MAQLPYIGLSSSPIAQTRIHPNLIQNCVFSLVKYGNVTHSDILNFLNTYITHIYKLYNVYIYVYIHMFFFMLLFKSMNVSSWCTAQVGTRLFFEEVNSCCKSPRDPSVKRHALLLWCGGSDLYKPVQVVIPVIPRIGYLGSPLKGGKKHQFFESLKKLSWNWLRSFSLREQSSAKSITHGFTERAKELLPAYQPHFGIGMWEVPYLIWIICNNLYVSW